MTVPPPPKPVPRNKILLIVGLLLVAAACGWLTLRKIVASGITKGPDVMFGDQHLKTSVALIELHKTRYGKYPDTLSALKFTGQWDQIVLQSVEYYPNPERTAYYLEVERGWMGKPNLEMPPEFWRGTGYSASLKPQ